MVRSPTSGLRSKQVRNPLQNEIPSFSILPAATPQAITHRRATIPISSHATIEAKCTGANIHDLPSFTAPNRHEIPSCIEAIVAGFAWRGKIAEELRTVRVTSNGYARPPQETTATTSPAFTVCPSVTDKRSIVPDFGARISFCIFIASTTIKPCPA